MHEQIRIFVAACFFYSGLVKLAHWWKQHPGQRQRLIILNYHRATGKNLRQQMRFLRRYYRILPLETALEELYSEHTVETQAHDKRMPLALTFDDGYHDNYSYGFKLTRELKIPITIFLIPGYIESGEHFWWLEGKRLVKRAQVDKVIVEGQQYRLDQIEERIRLERTIDARLRNSASVVEREDFLSTIYESLKVPTSVNVEEEAALPLTWPEVYKLEESGLVSFGAHTMHHPILSYLSDIEEVKHEISECRSVLEQRLGHPIRTFAYPIGKLEHIGKEGLQAVKEAGYKWALTTIEEVNTPQSDPYLLNRLPGDVEQHWLVMASELVGLLGIFSRIRKHYGRSFK
jgi:peptidoglycan/xylan/chitin deacetylase (PgdA/CDA1 family)